jgi:Mn2+/Fe2+ NRAMP family transporter
VAEWLDKGVPRSSPAGLGARRTARLKQFAALLGPGLVVMLADTDAGSVITASQSGAQWGYRLLLLQLLIIPVLFAAQELTVRLALSTGKGYGELILQHCGRTMAWLATLTLCVSCFGALVTEMSGLAGVGQLYGVPQWQTIVLAGGAIFAVVCTGSYRSVERVALALGAFELAFVLVAWLAKPDYRQVAVQMREIPWRDHRYLYLLAANLGTSIMPWTIFYQQSALLDKGLTLAHLKTARLDTLLGAVLCQLITAAVLIAAAAAFGAHGAGMTLQSVPDIAQAFTAVLGQGAGRALFAVALSGGALVATIVVCLALAWALGEIVGLRHSLASSPRQAPWFYAVFGAMLLAAGALVVSQADLVRLSIATGIVNALVLPLILGFLFWLARYRLPRGQRIAGVYAGVVAMVFLVTAGVGLYAAVAGILG